MFNRYNNSFAMKHDAVNALKALSGIGISLLENTPKNAFWYDAEDLEHRYNHEAALVGDLFWDGNNGDKHEVIAVDLENSRLAYRNLDQNDDLLDIACW